MKKSHKTISGVHFDSDVLDFLQALQTDFNRSRSFLVNDIVRGYAQTYREHATRPFASSEVSDA